MKVLVLGGAGFIGSSLCERLLSLGNEVLCVDNYSLGSEENVSFLKGREGFSLIQADATDERALDEAFSLFEPQYIYHLAANSDIQASAKDPEVEYKNTYTTTFRLLAAMRKHNVKNLFFASTSAVYGDKRDVFLDENTPNLSPISYYGAAKLGSEAMISAFSFMNDINALVFRFPNVIGRRLTHGVIFDFLSRLKENSETLRILGDGRQTKPYIYVDDLIDVIVRFRDFPQGMSIYNIGVDGATSVKKIADIICEEMGLSDVKYDFTGGEGGWKGDVPKFNYCLDKIHKEGWKAKYTSDEAVRMTVRDALGKGNDND